MSLIIWLMAAIFAMLLVRCCRLLYPAMLIAANIAITTITINSSTIVNPLPVFLITPLLFRLCLSFCNQYNLGGVNYKRNSCKLGSQDPLLGRPWGRVGTGKSFGGSISMRPGTRTFSGAAQAAGPEERVLGIQVYLGSLTWMLY